MIQAAAAQGHPQVGAAILESEDGIALPDQEDPTPLDHTGLQFSGPDLVQRHCLGEGHHTSFAITSTRSSGSSPAPATVSCGDRSDPRKYTSAAGLGATRT